MHSRLPAYRGHARVFLKDLEAIRPSAIIDIIHSGESFELGKEVKGGMKSMRESSGTRSAAFLGMGELMDLSWERVGDTENCLRCGYISSNDLCVS